LINRAGRLIKCGCCYCCGEFFLRRQH
jgi:hypothetical protein